MLHIVNIWQVHCNIVGNRTKASTSLKFSVYCLYFDLHLGQNSVGTCRQTFKFFKVSKRKFSIFYRRRLIVTILTFSFCYLIIIGDISDAWIELGFCVCWSLYRKQRERLILPNSDYGFVPICVWVRFRPGLWFLWVWLPRPAGACPSYTPEEKSRRSGEESVARKQPTS